MVPHDDRVTPRTWCAEGLELMAEPGVDERVSHTWDALTPGQQAVGAFIAERPSEAAFLGVRETASRLGVSTATVVRSAQALGFSGHQELIGHLQKEMLQRLGPRDRFETTISELADPDGDDPSHALDVVMRRDVESLERTLDVIDREAFCAAVDLVTGARNVYLLSIGLSQAPCEILTHRLPRVGIPTVFIDRPRPSALVPLTAEDILLVSSFRTPPEEELVRAARFSRRRGAAVVVLSGAPLSDLARLADVHLYAHCGSPSQMASMTAPLGVAHALAMTVAMKRRDAAPDYYALYEEVVGGGAPSADDPHPGPDDQLHTHPEER